MVDTPKICKPVESRPADDQPKGCMGSFADTNPKQNHVNITAMIRSLQRTEGVADCFRRGLADCDQLDCAWRQYCLENADGLTPKEDS